MIYEDYFKNIVGGNYKSPEYYIPTYENVTYEPRQVNAISNYNYIDINDYSLYPDIYKIVSPMIDKMLANKNISNLNETILDTMTLEIYDALEAEDNVNMNSNIRNNNVIGERNTNPNIKAPISNMESENTSGKALNRTSTNLANKNQDVKLNQVNSNIEPKTVEVATRCRNCSNPLLRDLIKIMILNKLFGNNQNPRPPRPRPYPNYRPTSVMPMDDVKLVNTQVYSNNITNPKTYFDVPYPEES